MLKACSLVSPAIWNSTTAAPSRTPIPFSEMGSEMSAARIGTKRK